MGWVAVALMLAAACNGNSTSSTPTPKTSPELKEHRARITSLSGDVRVKLASAAEYVSARAELGLTVDDRVFTGKDGHATITFETGQVVMVTPDSLVAIQTDALAQEQTTELMDGISVESGRVEVEIDPTVSNTLFHIKTPDAEGIVPMNEIEVVGSQ